MLALTRAVPFPERAFLYDYRAFAGAMLGTGGNPYRAEPLRTCEHRRGLLAGRSDLTLLAVPAPLPGYALAPFALLGRLPGGLGAALWLLVSLLAGAIAVQALLVIPGGTARPRAHARPTRAARTRCAVLGRAGDRTRAFRARRRGNLDRDDRTARRRPGSAGARNLRPTRSSWSRDRRDRRARSVARAPRFYEKRRVSDFGPAGAPGERARQRGTI